jgi:hypothetical protein
MAHDRSRISTFYKIVLTPTEYNDWSTLPRLVYVKRFNADWGKLNLAQQQSIAKWAWGQADEFMRRMMYVYPGEDGGVWASSALQTRVPDLAEWSSNRVK